jgi:hypothetical protein
VTIRLQAALLALSLACASAHATESEVANRNLGLTPKVLDKAKAAQSGANPEGKKAEPLKEEITVYGEAPEDYRKAQKAPIQAFADRLDKSRNLTPAQKAQMVLSFFLGGPMPEKEPSAEARTLSRSENGGTMMEKQRGTLQ